MKFAILTSAVLLGFIIQRAIRRSNHIIAKEKAEFWEREERARHTPPSSIDGLNWIKYPDNLPLSVDCGSKSKSLESTLLSLKDKPIVNLSGYSNTDLKLAYGTSNIEILSKADSNYLVMMRSLDSLASIYKKEGFTDESISLLQFAADCGSEKVEHFSELADYYFKHDDIECLKGLHLLAESVSEPRRSAIMQKLNEYLNLMEIFND